MKRFLFFLLTAVMMSSCGGHHHSNSGPYVNEFLLDCSTDVDNTVFVEIALPNGYRGILSEVATPTLGQIVLTSDTYNLGVFAPGLYTFELELVRLGPPPNGAFAKDLDGFIESCDLTIGDVIPVPPDPDPSCEPNLTVNLNEDGGVLFLVESCDCPLLLLFLDEEFLVETGVPTVIPFELVAGEYLWSVHKTGECGDDLVESGLIIVVGPIDPGPQPPIGILPPAWGLHKILVCHKGKQKLLPYPAASNLISQGKATLGRCENDD